MINFYRAIIESVLTFSLIVWFNSSTTQVCSLAASNLLVVIFPLWMRSMSNVCRKKWFNNPERPLKSSQTPLPSVYMFSEQYSPGIISLLIIDRTYINSCIYVCVCMNLCMYFNVSWWALQANSKQLGCLEINKQHYLNLNLKFAFFSVYSKGTYLTIICIFYKHLTSSYL